jgi:hypothetical protein
MDKKSVIDQLLRAIKAKDTYAQRKAGQPSILVLDFWDWRYNYFEYDDFNELKRILTVSQVSKRNELLGSRFSYIM